MIENHRQSIIPQKFQVERISNETDDTFTLSLSSKHFSFSPGQFNMLYAFGFGEVPISISGDPAKTEIIKHTIRDVGPVTSALRKLKKGDTLGVRGPFGIPWPLDNAKGKDVILITGGIGLAPLRPAFYHLMSQRQDFGKVALLLGTRTPQDIIFRKEVSRWRANLDLQVLVTVDDAQDDWNGRVGVVTTLIPKASFDPKNSIAMICGPEIMMRFSVQELLNQGLNTEDIYISMERNMKCGNGLCGHCQYGSYFVCKNGPVFRYSEVENYFHVREI